MLANTPWAVLYLIAAIWLVFVVPARMAARRNRSVTAWILISLVLSPIAAILLLWGIGAAPRQS